MRKMITLIAAAALVASPFAFAEDTTGNPNDVLQTVPGQANGPTIADAGTAPAAPDNASAGDSAPSGNDAAANGDTAKPKHHKHHVKKHHHHHHKKAATTPSEKETPNALGTEMPAEHPGQ
jgi:hypothetical protein